MIKSILAVGCSYTYGLGLDKDKHDPKLWVNQISSYFNARVENLALPGRNNEWIFHTTAQELMANSDHYDLVIVGWSNIPRYGFNWGLEEWSTWRIASPISSSNIEVALHNNDTVTTKELGTLASVLYRHHNDHWDIANLVTYVNALQKYHTNVVFVNAMGDWDNNYFVRADWQKPSELTPFTQQVLDVENRSDVQIDNLYRMIHNTYKARGGISPQRWLNLYDSLKKMRVDTVSKDDNHPGYQSQDLYTSKFIPLIEEKFIK